MRTDLAHEIAAESGLTLKETIVGGIEITHITINNEASKKTGKAAGDYTTMFCREKDTENEMAVLAHILSGMLGKVKRASPHLNAIVTGLGNENITPDSLGVRTAGKVLATAHFFGQSEFAELGLQEVYVLQPGVMAQTGLESATQLKLLADGINPDCLVVVDSLACSERQRLARTIQVTNAGISPGSGVENQRKEFSEATFGVPVIAIGVPLVIDMKGDSQEALMLVPRDIDVLVNHYAKVISGAINKVLNPNLDEKEIEQLLM